MEKRTLRAHMKARGWNQSELARQVGISRQAVSLWFRQGEQVGLRGAHLLRLGEVLGLPVEEIARPLPCFGDDHDRLEAELLWDRLYPDLDDFAIAVAKGELSAVARLVEVYGLFASAKVAGDWIWEAFLTYQRFIHPARRRALRRLAEWHGNRIAG
jgi:transcriptional regulator with XRE-family HTH domain